MGFRYLKMALTSTFISLLGAATALAGDTSTLNVLGFSQDGGIFVFEEYGIQDGSGFPYANRFYIDTSTDQFISGSPIRIRLDDENAALADARATAQTQGNAIINDMDLQPGYTAGFNPITESSADPYRMAVNPRPVVPPVDKEIEFRVNELPFAASGTCQGVQDVSMGFSLTMVGVQMGETAKLLHEDGSVPSSRGCPNGYRIGGVHTYFPQMGSPIYAITIAIRSFGFEGPDHRWMAVTTQQSETAQ